MFVFCRLYLYFNAACVLRSGTQLVGDELQLHRPKAQDEYAHYQLEKYTFSNALALSGIHLLILKEQSFNTGGGGGLKENWDNTLKTSPLLIPPAI